MRPADGTFPPSGAEPHKPSPHADTAPAVRLPNLTRDEQHLLLTVAKASIEHGLHRHGPLALDPAAFPPALREPWAAFVTLHHQGRLRGCIGTLEATHPLVCAVARFAWHAAFQDTRFAPLEAEELRELDIHISILSPPVPLHFESETDLLAQLQPGADGLLIEAGPYHATFLPSVWETLPEKTDFLRHLKRKAGLSPDYWSRDLRASRYRACGFSALATKLDTTSLPMPRL